VTLGEEHAIPADVLGKPDLSPSADDNSVIVASTEAKIDCVNDPLKESPPEIVVVPDVDTSVAPKTDTVRSAETTVTKENMQDTEVPENP
ncbi:hypothetical protein A2U01_0081047, partial [Trifolium medium]|nr:hypothetical protein [Trifolium medium]